MCYPVQAVSHKPGHPRCPFHRLEAQGLEGVPGNLCADSWSVLVSVSGLSA